MGDIVWSRGATKWESEGFADWWSDSKGVKQQIHTHLLNQEKRAEFGEVAFSAMLIWTEDKIYIEEEVKSSSLLFLFSCFLLLWLDQWKTQTELMKLWPPNTCNFRVSYVFHWVTDWIDKKLWQLIFHISHKNRKQIIFICFFQRRGLFLWPRIWWIVLGNPRPQTDVIVIYLTLFIYSSFI